MIGQTISHYKITEKIGEGGMGEVYKARDTRLDRTVAIKVLPSHVASNPEARQRFEREARAVSSLNHPHICTLHDIGSEDGVDFMVMEHIEGDTLADRLKKGALSLDEALCHGIEIADALDKAHQQGIVHRDLKPGNIMLTKSGAKLLDFGLAKTTAGLTSVAGHSALPTEAEPLTQEGSILGTIQYMAPEQLEGREADTRTDIFAFGTVLYEMVTGKKAFEGKSQASLIGAIMNSEPQPMVELQEMTPRSLDHVVRRCLDKDPDDRWQTAGDLMRELKWVGEVGSELDAGTQPADSSSRGRERLAWVIGTAVVLAAGLVAGSLVWSPLVTDLRRVAFSVFPPEGTVFQSVWSVPFAPSPDGAQMVLTAVDADGTPRLWLRPIEEDAFQPIPGTEGARSPFWSPQSDWIGFYTDGALKRVRPSGRELGTITNISTGRFVDSTSATWGSTHILFKPGRFNNPYMATPVEGGPVKPAARTAPDDAHTQRWAYFLEDGTRFVYSAVTKERRRGIYLASLDGEDTTVLLELPRRARPIASVPGYLLLIEDNTLYAMAFDEENPGELGDRRRVVEGIPVMGHGVAPFSASRDVLMFWENPVGYDATLRWFGRDGTPGPVLGAEARFLGFDLLESAGVAFARVREDGSQDVFRTSLDQTGDISVTIDGNSSGPVLSRDGSQIAYASARGRAPFLHTEHIATGIERGWPTEDLIVKPQDWGPNDDLIVYDAIDTDGRTDIGFFRFEDEVHERFGRNTPEFNESSGAISPDGNWILWVTDESGRDQVWAARFPSFDNPHFIAGGDFPKWRSDGGELYFVSEGSLMTRRVANLEPNLELEPSEEILDLTVHGAIFGARNAPYEPSADGQRFLLHVRSEESVSPPVKVIVNWTNLIGHK